MILQSFKFMEKHMIKVVDVSVYFIVTTLSGVLVHWLISLLNCKSSLKKLNESSKGVAECFGKNPDMSETELMLLIGSQAKKHHIKTLTRKNQLHILEIAYSEISDCNFLQDTKKNSILKRYTVLKNLIEETHLTDKMDLDNIKELNAAYFSVTPFIVGITIGIIGLCVYGILNPPKAIQLFYAIILTMVINTVIVASMIKKS